MAMYYFDVKGIFYGWAEGERHSVVDKASAQTLQERRTRAFDICTKWSPHNLETPFDTEYTEIINNKRL